MTTLTGQTILIVGGSSGIGFGVAKLSLLSGASRDIIASSSRDRVVSAIDRLAKALGDEAGVKTKVVGEVVDARSGKEVRGLVERVGEIDHLVWTSGEALRLDFINYDLDQPRGEGLGEVWMREGVLMFGIC